MAGYDYQRRWSVLIFEIFTASVSHPIDLSARARLFRIKIAQFDEFRNAIIKTGFGQFNIRNNIINLLYGFRRVEESAQYISVRYSTGPSSGHTRTSEGGDLYCNHSEISNRGIGNSNITNCGKTKCGGVNSFGNDSLGTLGPHSNVMKSARGGAECSRGQPMINRNHTTAGEKTNADRKTLPERITNSAVTGARGA